MKIVKYIILSLCVATIFSCNQYRFDKEQYIHRLSLLSNSNLEYDRQVAKISQAGDTVYMVVQLSGSQPAEKDFPFTLEKNDSLFKKFNQVNYDNKKDLFAKLLSEECYEIASLEGVVKKGTFTARIPIKLKNLERLSPDSLYFLNYRIKVDESNKDYVNPKKKDVLFKVLKKNDIASSVRPETYVYNKSLFNISAYTNAKTKKVVPASTKKPSSSVNVYVLGENTIRVVAGVEYWRDYKKAQDDIKKKSIVIEIGEQTADNPSAKHVTIKAYEPKEFNPAMKANTDKLEVNMLEATSVTSLKYDNTFVINTITTPDGRSTYYKEFHLHYKYRLKADPTDKWTTVKAILRKPFNPNEDKL